MIHPITFDASLIKEATNYQKRVSKTATLNTVENYTALTANNRYLVGTIGELCFKKYLTEAGIQFEHQMKSDGFSDDYDFLIGGKRYEVRTASKKTHKMLMTPEVKFEKEKGKYDYIVGVRLDLPNWVAEIFGMIGADESFEVADFGYGVPTVYIELDKLRALDFNRANGSKEKVK